MNCVLFLVFFSFGQAIALTNDDFLPLKMGNKWVYLGSEDGSISLSPFPDIKDSVLRTIEIASIKNNSDTIEFEVVFKDSIFSRPFLNNLKLSDTVTTYSIIISKMPNGRVFEKYSYNDTIQYINNHWLFQPIIDSAKTSQINVGVEKYIFYDTSRFVPSSSQGGFTYRWTLFQNFGIYKFTQALSDRQYFCNISYILLEFNGEKLKSEYSSIRIPKRKQLILSYDSYHEIFKSGYLLGRRPKNTEY